MNAAQAKQIQIVSLLELMGHKPSLSRGSYFWYKSPIRNERNYSFRVHTDKNYWYDAGTGEGGNIIKLVMECYQCDMPDALRYIASLTNQDHKINLYEPTLITEIKQSKGVQIKKVVPLRNQALIQYVESRSIPFKLANIYLQEVYFYMNDKDVFGLCWSNTNGGFEIRNKYFKTSSSKGYTFLPGTQEGQSKMVNVFEGMFDFLSYCVITDSELPRWDTIILNSTSFVKGMIGQIQCYEVANLFLDPDQAGSKATQLIKENHLKAYDYSINYQDFEDLNHYHNSVSRSLIHVDEWMVRH